MPLFLFYSHCAEPRLVGWYYINRPTHRYSVDDEHGGAHTCWSTWWHTHSLGEPGAGCSVDAGSQTGRFRFRISCPRSWYALYRESFFIISSGPDGSERAREGMNFNFSFCFKFWFHWLVGSVCGREVYWSSGSCKYLYITRAPWRDSTSSGVRLQWTTEVSRPPFSVYIFQESCRRETVYGII